ncbi:unnamed protein product [Cylindrotheca closterium]|uniref:Uncharacterized protein n=1 Tax=Cylindrotheca closterium TaxID=2856 RepID=A0AAD2FET2_9STRA|nr:unnamed protein product [Cylindrotheca closterium]
MSDVEYYKKMMRQGDTTDYTSGEFLGEQGASHRTKSPSSMSKKWTKTKEHVNTDWLGASPGKARKSYTVKAIVKPSVHVSDDEEEEETKVEAAPTPAPVPKEEDKPAEEAASPPSPTPAVAEAKKEEEEEVDPAVAKYKAMLRAGDSSTDYSTNEFLGDQAQSHRTSTTKKKWGKPIERSNDDWLSASPGKARKSYTVKAVKKAVHHDSEDEKEKETEPVQSSPVKTTTAPVTEPEPEKEEDKAPSSPVKAAPEEVDPAIAKYKAMLRAGDSSTDYSTNEFLGDQAQSHRTSKSPKKWGKPIERSNDDWLGPSPGSRKSYTIKKVHHVPPPDVHYTDEEEEEKPKKEESPKKEEPAAEPAPKEDDVSSPVAEQESAAEPTPQPDEKKEEVDPSIAKYKAMLRAGDSSTDYSTNEFLGDQAQSHRTSKSPKKWGKPIERSNDDWLGPSPGSRKSYTIKSKSTPKPTHNDDDNDEPKQVSPAKHVSDIKPPQLHDEDEEPAKEPEVVDPSIAKYKAMMHRDEGNDYATNEFLGEQGQAHRAAKSPKKKHAGKPIEKSNDHWMGSGGTARKSYTIKGSSTSSSKPPFSPASPVTTTKTRASFSSMASPTIASQRMTPSFDHASPVSAKERMGTRASFSHAMTSMQSPKVTSPRGSLTHESPVSEKERMAGRASFSNAFAKFRSSDTTVPAAFAHSIASPVKRNFHVPKEAVEREKEAHRHDDEHHEPTIKEGEELATAEGVSEVHEDHKEEFEEALQMLQKIFNRLDDREPSWKQMDAVIKKIRKATNQGADIKAILSYSISSLQHIAGLLYDEDQTDTDDVVEKLIDLNMQI